MPTARKTINRKIVRSGRPNITEFQKGAISALSQQGLTGAKIAEALGLHQGTIYKNLQKLKAEGVEPFALSSEIVRNVLPIAALRQAQAVMDDSDIERADQASYRMLKGGGVYQEQVHQTVQSVPDQEIMLAMTDMLLSALNQAEVSADYTVQTDADRGEAPVSSGESTANPTINTTEAQAEAPSNTDAQPTNKPSALGELMRKGNAQRMIAKADRNRTEGRPKSDEPDRPT